MALSLVTPPTTEPISLDEAKAQCRYTENDQDLFLESLISAAREYVESFTHRALITQTWDLKLCGFPSECAIQVPKAPLVSVTSVTYINTAGVSTLWASTLYTVDAPVGPQASRGSIVPAYGQIYPSTRDVPNAVIVRFVAGYGAATSVPWSILAAMKLLVAHWWENRAPVNIGNIVTAIPLGVDSLLWPYKAF